MKLVVLVLFCVAFVAAAPATDFELEDEPRSSEIHLEDDDFDLEDEPRSTDAGLKDDDEDDLDMRDGIDEGNEDSHDSQALEPTERQGWFRRTWGRGRRWYNRQRNRYNNWKVRTFGRWARNVNPVVKPGFGGRPWRFGLRWRF